MDQGGILMLETVAIVTTSVWMAIVAGSVYGSWLVSKIRSKRK